MSSLTEITIGPCPITMLLSPPIPLKDTEDLASSEASTCEKFLSSVETDKALQVSIPTQLSECSGLVKIGRLVLS